MVIVYPHEHTHRHLIQVALVCCVEGHDVAKARIISSALLVAPIQTGYSSFLIGFHRKVEALVFSLHAGKQSKSFVDVVLARFVCYCCTHASERPLPRRDILIPAMHI